jgi:hypothetical protein
MNSHVEDLILICNNNPKDWTINKISTILANTMKMKRYVLIGLFICILMGKENE